MFNFGKKKKQKQVAAIIDFVCLHLDLQATFIKDDNDKFFEAAVDDWSIGYIVGVIGAVLQVQDIPMDDQRSYDSINQIFTHVFGFEDGRLYIHRFTELQQSNSRILFDGQVEGGNEVYEVLRALDEGQTLMLRGWAAHANPETI